MANAAPAKLPCLEQQPNVCSRLAHALSRCITTEAVAGPVSKALRLLFPASVHMRCVIDIRQAAGHNRACLPCAPPAPSRLGYLSIELPVLPKVLLSTQNLLVEGPCALMFYSLSNTLAGHVYSTRCATSATARMKRCGVWLGDSRIVTVLCAGMMRSCSTSSTWGSSRCITSSRSRSCSTSRRRCCIMALPLNPRPLCSTTCPSLPPPPSWVL